MFEFPLVAVLIIVALMFISSKLINDKERSERNGKIEIKFLKTNILKPKEDKENILKYTILVLEIKYRLMKGSRYNKEETAILINDWVQRVCKFEKFRIRNNTKETLKEIKGIIEKTKPSSAPDAMGYELIAVEYRISEKTIPNWGKDINFIPT